MTPAVVSTGVLGDQDDPIAAGPNPETRSATIQCGV